MSEQAQIEPKCFNKPLGELTEHELRCELAFWQQRIDSAEGWGASLDAAVEFRDECERQLERLENQRQNEPTPDFHFGQLVIVGHLWRGVVIAVGFDGVRVALEENGDIGWWNRKRLERVEGDSEPASTHYSDADIPRIELSSAARARRVINSLAEHMPEEALREASYAICQSGKFECGQGRCAPICLDSLGNKPKKCAHALQVHSRLVTDAISTFLKHVGERET